MSDRDDICQNEEKKEVLRELSEAIRTPEFQKRREGNIAKENERVAWERDIDKPSQRQMEESFTI